MDTDEAIQMEEALMGEIANLLTDAGYGEAPTLNDMQPPSSVIRLVSQIAAKALVIFERAYRMTSAAED